MSETQKSVKNTSPASPHPSGRYPSRVAAHRQTTGAIDLSSLIVIVIVILAIGVAGIFIYRGSSLKTQLVKAQDDAKKQSTEMQTQIDAAAAKAREAADLQAQAQAQADQAKAEAAKAKASAETAAKQVEELRGQLDQAKRQLAEAKVNADKLSAEAAKLKAQLEAMTEAAPTSAPTMPATTPVRPPAPAPAAPAAPAKPATTSQKAMPLNATFKKAPMLDGIALALENTSADSLSVSVRFSNSGGSKEFEVNLGPGATKDIGWLGEWVLASGDKAEIKCPGYDAIVKTAP